MVWRLIRRHLRSDGTAIQPYAVVHIIIGAAMNREMMSQAEADEEILTLDVSDDLLERAGSVEQNAVTWVYCTHGYHYCEWPQ